MSTGKESVKETFTASMNNEENRSDEVKIPNERNKPNDVVMSNETEENPDRDRKRASNGTERGSNR